MAYEELKAQIREYIKPNEQEEITGAIMQAILLEMVNQLGAEGSYLPLTGGNVTGGIVVSSDLSSPSHEALRLNQSGISVEKIASVGLNEILNVTANSITYSSYFPSETPNTLTISLGYTGVTLSGGVTAASFINSSVDASIRYQYLLKADGNVISISDIGGTDMQTVWEALAASTNEQINVSHLSTALNGYIHPTLSNLSNGDILVYDSVGTWVNTSMSSFLSGYATETWVNTQLASYATQSWVNTNYLSRVSTNSGNIYINDGGSAWVLANLNTLIVGYGYITASALNGYATEAWVGQQGYLTSSALNGYIHPTITNLANGDILIYDSVGTWVNTPLSSFGFATQTWVGQQGYITSSALNGYATQSWVTSQGYIQPTLSNLANGDILVYDSGVNWVNAPLDTTISGFGYVKSTGSVAYATSAGSANILGHTVYENPAHALANGDMLVYDSGTGWTNVETSSILSGYATQSWVNQQGFLTSSALNGYIHPTLTNLANGDILVYDSVGAWYNVPMSSFLAGYATQSWVTTQLAGYLPLTGGMMTGTITMTANAVQMNFRTGHETNSYNSKIEYMTDGNEALVWANKNENTSFIFLCGVDIPNSSSYWMYLTPALQIKKQSVYINELIGNGVTPAYNLHVNGTFNATSIYQNGTAISSIYLAPTLSNLSNGDVLVYDSVGAWYNTPMSSFLTGYATESWVTSQGFITSAGSCNSATTSLILLTNNTAQNADSCYNQNPGLRFWRYNGSSSTTGQTGGDGWILSWSWNVGSVGGQIYLDDNPTKTICIRGCEYNGSFTTWATLLHSDNYESYTVTKTGGGASGTWGIDITGSANYATSAGSANILGHSVTLNSAHSLSNGDILVYDSAGTWTNVSSGLSDIRQKDVINYNAEPTFEAVANAPAIRFTYKDATYSFRRGVHIGSIAQYWQTTLPETVSMDNDGILSMQYDVIALLSTISVAKKVSEHERRIILLERENEQLKKEIEALKSA